MGDRTPGCPVGGGVWARPEQAPQPPPRLPTSLLYSSPKCTPAPSVASVSRSSFLPSCCVCHVQQHGVFPCPFLLQPECTGGAASVQAVIEKLREENRLLRQKLIHVSVCPVSLIPSLVVLRAGVSLGLPGLTQSPET